MAFNFQPLNMGNPNWDEVRKSKFSLGSAITGGIGDALKAGWEGYQQNKQYEDQQKQLKLDNDMKAKRYKDQLEQQELDNEYRQNQATQQLAEAEKNRQLQLKMQKNQQDQEWLSKAIDAEEDAERKVKIEKMAKDRNDIRYWQNKLEEVTNNPNVPVEDKPAHARGITGNIDRHLEAYRAEYGDEAYEQLMKDIQQNELMKKALGSVVQQVDTARSKAKAQKKKREEEALL